MKTTGTVLQILSLGIVATLAFAGGYLLNERNKIAQARLEREAALQLKVPAPIEVATLTLKTRPWQETLSYTGTVAAWRATLLAFAEPGIVETLHVDKGHAVTGPGDESPGAPLASIDRERIEASVRAAQASLEKTSWDLAQARRLLAQDSVSEEHVKALETLSSRRQAELTQARKSLADATLRAPFAGVIADRMIELGEAASPQNPAFRLIQLSRVKVVVGIPGRRINQIRLGQRADVEVQVGPDQSRTLVGKVHYIPPAAVGLLFAVEVALDNPEGILREGMIATARLFGRKHPEMFVLPLETVIQVGALRQVMLMDKEGRVSEGFYDLGLLPAAERERVTAQLELQDEEWSPVTGKSWLAIELTAVQRLAAKVAAPKAHRLRGRGIEVYHLGKRARSKTLTSTRIEGDQCLVPNDGTLEPGDILIARGQYRVVDGGEVRLSKANELSLPGQVDDR